LIPEDRDIFPKVGNGIIFCKLLNKCDDDKIDERTILNNRREDETISSKDSKLN
jgi:hypothetical protein